MEEEKENRGQRSGKLKGIRYDPELKHFVSTKPKEEQVKRDRTFEEEKLKHFAENLEDATLMKLVRLAKYGKQSVQLDATKALMIYIDKQAGQRKYREMDYVQLKEELVRELRELRRLEKKPSSEVFIDIEGTEEEGGVGGDVEVQAAGEAVKIPQFPEAGTVCDRGESVRKDDVVG